MKPKKIKQNLIPEEFDYFYAPILATKKILQSNCKELDINVILQGLVMIHYATFIVTELYRQKALPVNKIFIIRNLIQNILDKTHSKLENTDISQIVSFIDQLAKELNINHKPYVYIALYTGNLHAEIYRKIHNNLYIYQLIDNGPFLNKPVEDRVRLFYDASITILTELGLSTSRQFEKVKP